MNDDPNSSLYVKGLIKDFIKVENTHFSDASRIRLLVVPCRFFLYLQKRRKCRRRECNEARLSFGFSDIRATYARFLTPQIAKKIFFFVFLPPPRSSIMSLFISPTIVLPPRCSNRLSYSARLYTAIVEKKLQLEQEISIASFFSAQGCISERIAVSRRRVLRLHER